MAADIYFDKVVLLLHCDGSDGSTTFTDSSPSAHTVTAHGDAQVDTSDKQFGTGSAQFDGTGDYLSIPDSDDWAFGEDPFTIDVFHKFSSTPGTEEYQALVAVYQDANNWWELYYDDSGVYFDYVFSGAIQVSLAATTSPDTTTWHMVSLDWYDGTLTLFLDGAVADSATYGSGIAGLSSPLYIGSWNGTDDLFTGRLDEIRFTKNRSRYEGTAFTQPTEAFPDYLEATGTGDLSAESSSVSGSGTVEATTERTGTGALAAQSASIASSGGTIVQPSLPISINILLPVVVGLPIRIDIYSAVTPTLPITIGPYPVAVTLPITIKTPVAATLPTVTITFPGAYAAVASALLTWTPKCVLDGVDISAKLISAQDIEFDENGSPVATFSFIPASGAIDPLMYVGKAVSLSITIGTATYLAFTGIVSDPVWNADDRTITVSATGDLQSKLDAMPKTAILAQVGGTFSEYVFDDPNNLSGWEYAEALVSTQPKVVWQDANGWIRTTSILAKASADYTYTTADILDTAHVVRWAGRMDITNTISVTLGYRFQRRRQRNLTFAFRPWQLETPSVYLSGNEGGWDLPQRTQIESAANGGGWTVLGDITYTDVWPNGYYSTYSDSGTPMMEGLSLTREIAADLCIGAQWTAAKRWLQPVTESYTLTVTASDSIAAVGTLATEEAYAIEDDATDEAWESSLDYDDYVSGAAAMANGVDKKADLDSIRADVTTAMSVALAKAQNDVLKSHRGTTVAFTTTYDPRVDLGHTVAVDTTYLDCKGKVRRIAHHWDIDTGDCTTEIEVALSRHNGSGTASTDTLTPPSEPADSTEATPSKYHRLLMHIGGQITVPDWDETWDGYVVNMPFSAAAGSATILGSWARNPANPEMANKVYEEGMHILPPEIAATYADPAAVTATSSYDVAVPNDTLTLISG